jgi:hypothetical protein
MAAAGEQLWRRACSALRPITIIGGPQATAYHRTLKAQTSYSLKLHDVRKAAAAYELMHSAAALLQMLPVSVLEALRDYVQEEVKDGKGY